MKIAWEQAKGSLFGKYTNVNFFKTIVKEDSYWPENLTYRNKTRSKLKWAFPYQKYYQIKGTPLKYTIFPSIIKLVNLFLCLYSQENQAYS
jgi:hypothetical protein